MINRLCPEGVKYVKLGEACEMKRGTSVTKSSIVEGDIPVISGGMKPAYYCNSYNREGETITVAGSGASAGYIMFWNEPIFVCDAFSIKAKGDNLTKYIFHVLKNMQAAIQATKKGGGVPHVHISSIENFIIPLPPVSVQLRIVEVLDKMTTLTAELEAELEARKQQYEYYRNKLLTFNEIGGGIRLVRLGDVCEIGTGSHNTQDGLSEGMYPFYTRGIEILYLNSFDYDETAIITAGDGAGVGKVIHFVSGKYALHQRAYRIVADKKQILARYVYHYMRATFYNYIMRSSVSSSVTSVRKPMLYDYPIPLPSLEEQKRIVSILDRFEALTTDLQIGLPAEIEARRQQYEYYRNKLLTFDKAA